MRAALIDIQSGKIENVIELSDDYDAKAEGAYLPPSNYRIEVDTTGEAEVGGRFNNGVWEKRIPSEPEVVPPSTQEQLDALTERLVAKGTITEAEATAVREPRPTEPAPSPTPR